MLEIMAKQTPYKFPAESTRDDRASYDRPLPQSPAQIQANAATAGPQRALIDARVPDHPIPKGTNPASAQGENPLPKVPDTATDARQAPYTNMTSGR